MRNRHTHTIGKLAVEVTFNRHGPLENGMAVQQRVKEWVYEKLLPALEVAFEKLDISPNETLLIDKLEIDLGSVLEKGWEVKIVEQLPQQMEREMEVAHVEKKEELIRIKNIEKPLEEFIYFLKKGRLPWWVSVKEMNFEKWENGILKQFKNERKYDDEIINLLKNNNSAERLVMQFPDQFFNKIFSL